MVWLSTVLILGFGAITLYLHDPKFIQMKPTLYLRASLAILLFAGLLTGKPLLRWLFGPDLPRPRRRGLAQAQPQLGAVLRRPRRSPMR